MVTRWTFLGLVLLAVGLLTAGVGAATHVDEQQCRSTQHVSVAPVNDTADAAANDTPTATGTDGATASGNEPATGTERDTVTATGNDAGRAAANATPYEHLSATERAVFRQALGTRGGVLTSRGAIDPGTVRYENRTYAVRVSRESDCAPYHPRRVLLPAIGGLALAVTGLGLARGRNS